MGRATIKSEWFKGLTEKQIAFVLAYCDDAFAFNATAAAKEAGYQASSNHAFQQIGWQNLRVPKIHAAIQKVMGTIYAAADLTIEKVLIDLEHTRQKAMQDRNWAVAAKCSELHGKYLKMFVDRVEHVRTVDDATEDELVGLLNQLTKKLDGTVTFPGSPGGAGGAGSAEGSGADREGTPTTH